MSNTVEAIVVATEVWNTKDGKVIKAVTRNEKGTFLGATNQTKGISLSSLLVGVSR